MELACAAPGDFYELLGVSINADKDVCQHFRNANMAYVYVVYRFGMHVE